MQDSLTFIYKLTRLHWLEELGILLKFIVLGIELIECNIQVVYSASFEFLLAEIQTLQRKLCECRVGLGFDNVLLTFSVVPLLFSYLVLISTLSLGMKEHWEMEHNAWVSYLRTNNHNQIK